MSFKLRTFNQQYTPRLIPSIKNGAFASHYHHQGEDMSEPDDEGNTYMGDQMITPSGQVLNIHTLGLDD